MLIVRLSPHVELFTGIRSTFRLMRKLFLLAIFPLPSDELILIIALSDDFYFLTYDGEIKRGTDNAKFLLN